MPKLKFRVLPVAAIALACLPAAPAAAAGPLLAPLILGHAIGAAARLAETTIAAASILGQQQARPVAPYAQPGYYYSPRVGNYYSPPPAYQPRPSYYYAPARYLTYPSRYASGYRGYYAPSMRYSGGHGTPFYGARGYSYRRR
jgi:hypothetical protein